MRVLVAPDSFKGSLDAMEAARAIERGVKLASPDAVVDLCPLSDGGEGVGPVLAGALGGTARTAVVTGPLGASVTANWWALPDERTAILESARAIGLDLVPERARAPLRASSRGVGELLLSALDASRTRILIGLGGTGTVDGGAGMADAIGVGFEGVTSRLTPERLFDATALDFARRDPRFGDVTIEALTDVDAPLVGSDGAAHAFGPQKGASKADCERLDAALGHLQTLTNVPGTNPGDGAAGGLGYGLRVFAGATLVRGIDVVLDAVRFDQRLGVDLVLTGEGRLDATSARGKVISGVAERAALRGVPVVALVGSADRSAEALLSHGLAAYFPLVSGTVTEVDAKRDAAALLERLAQTFVSDWASRRPMLDSRPMLR